jgi:hypothetical protein
MRKIYEFLNFKNMKDTSYLEIRSEVEVQKKAIEIL